MKRLILSVLLVVMLGGCGPQVPTGLQDHIKQSHPDAKFIEAKEITIQVPTTWWTVWCVAYSYEVPNSGKWVSVELYFERTNGWEIVTGDPRGRQLFSPGMSKQGNWCDF